MANFVICRDHYAMTISHNTLPKERSLLIRFLFRVNCNKNYTFRISILPYSIYDKTVAKSVDLSPK